MSESAMTGVPGVPGVPGGSGAEGVSGAPEMTVATAFAGMKSVVPVMFRAGCPDCRGSFELAASALRLAIGATSRTTFYSFTCPDCGAAVRKPAGSGSSNCSSAAE